MPTEEEKARNLLTQIFDRSNVIGVIPASDDDPSSSIEIERCESGVTLSQYLKANENDGPDILVVSRPQAEQVVKVLQGWLREVQ